MTDYGKLVKTDVLCYNDKIMSGVNLGTRQPITPMEWHGAVPLYEHPAILHAPDARLGKLPRFILDNADVVRETYVDTQARLQDIMAQDEAVAGATVFGSTTKGYATERSDLDMTVYVDAEKLGLQLVNPYSTTEPIFGYWWAYGPKETMLQHEEFYDSWISNQINPNPETSPLLKQSVEVVPVSMAHIELVASIQAKQAKAVNLYQELRAEQPDDDIEALADWSTVLTNQSVLARIPGLPEAMKAVERESEYMDIIAVKNFLDTVASIRGDRISKLRAFVFWDCRFDSPLCNRLFGLAITPGVARYRTAFLSAVAKSEDPDRTWAHFAQRLAMFEDSPKHRRDISRIAYPETFNQAVSLYADSAL
jgi:predicted nucleotidyltransferase